MTQDGRLDPEMAKLVHIPIVERFAAGEIGQRMKQAERAGVLYRERPFVMGLTAEELSRFGFSEETAEGTDSEELTLIQGIIDVFWMEEDGIVLLDYKTDFVQDGRQLVERYQAQMELYADALTRIFSGRYGDRPVVKERIIYSFCLDCAISL
jgi:ATP-dependent helicase/nuclease subunit A